MAPQNYCCFFNWQKTSHSLCDSSRVQQSSIHCPTCPRSQRHPLLCAHPCDKPNIRWPLDGQEGSDCGRRANKKSEEEEEWENGERSNGRLKRKRKERRQRDKWRMSGLHHFSQPIFFLASFSFSQFFSLSLLSFSFPIPPTSDGRTSAAASAEKDRGTDEPHHTCFEQAGERQKVILQMSSHSMIASERASWNECWRRKQNQRKAEKHMCARTQQEKEKEEETKGLKRILHLTEFTTTNTNSLCPYVSVALAPFRELECSIKTTPT